MNNDNDIWVFLSHSNEDFSKVRKLRNLLEENGFRPIMFYLKCMEDETRIEELRTLINDEIDSRNRFIYCQSIKAQISSWVKEELKHLRETNRSYDTFDVDNTNDQELENFVERYKDDSMVYISYARDDIKIAEDIFYRLGKYDKYRVFLDKDSVNDITDYASQLKSAIQHAATRGIFISLLSKNAISRQWVKEEIQTALRLNQKKHLIPVILDDFKKTSQLESPFQQILNYHSIDVSHENEVNKANIIVDKLIEMWYTPGDILAMANQFRDNLQDKEEAERLYAIFFRLADESQNPMALYTLAKCYEFGYGVPIDLNQAYNLYCECRAEMGGNSLIGSNTLNQCCQRVYDKMH